MKRYYIAVCVPLASGGWRAIFPDAPGCEVEGHRLDRVVFRARNELFTHATGADKTLPLSRDLAEIRSDTQWAAANAIDWPRTVITMIPLQI